MKASTKIFTCLCAFLTILTAFFIRDTIRDCRKKKERLTQPINIAEHVGRFERIVYDKYEGNYEGTDISNDFVLGLKLEGRDSVIRTKHIPSGFSRGDSVWVVKGYAFDGQPSENVVRRLMLSEPRYNTLWIMTKVLCWFVIVGAILFLNWYLLTKRKG